ncbi:MAG: ribonuclease E/G [Pseudomonadota bacterium]
MTKRVLIERLALETRIALIDDEGPIEILHESPLVDRGPRYGSVYRGRIKGRTPNGAGAFVDLGVCDGFLPTQKNGRGYEEGAGGVFQIRREAEAGKSAIVSDEVVFASALAVVSSRRGATTLSGRATAEIAGESLRMDAEAWADGFETVVRVSALERPHALRLEIGKAVDRARVVADASEDGPPGAIIGSGDALAVAASRWAAENVDVVSANRDEESDRYSERCDRTPGSETFRVEEIDAAFEQAVALSTDLPGGARLTFEKTSALVAVDVDLGGARTMKAPALWDGVARGLRIRRLAGQIVVDLPAFIARGGKGALRAALLSAAAGDPEQLRWAEMAEGGLVILNRRSVGPSWLEAWTAPTAAAPTAGRLWSADMRALDAARALERALSSERAARFNLATAPALCDRLQKAGLEDALRARYGARFTLRSEDRFADQKEFDLVPL